MSHTASEETVGIFMVPLRIALAAVVLSLLAFPVVAGGAGADNASGASDVSRGYVVTFREIPGEVRTGHYGPHEVIATNDALHFAVVRTTDGRGLAARAQNDANVMTLEDDIEVHALFTPNDRFYATYQYDVQGGTTGIDAAWDVTTGATAVKVAIADTGVRLTAEDLVGICVAGQYDLVSNDGIAQDGNGHGSHVASTLFAKINNGKGLAGISQTCGLFARVLDNQGSGTCSQVANGITWAADQGAHILSLSLGGGACSAEQNAVAYAQGKGTLIVAAAGNDGPCTNCILYPARYAGVIAVTCTDQTNSLCSFSSTGPEAFLGAPGKSTVGHYPSKRAGCGKALDTCYALLSGTSMSTPHVAGVAALIKSTHTAYTASDIKTTLQSTARDLGASGRDDAFGFGLLQATGV